MSHTPTFSTTSGPSQTVPYRHISGHPPNLPPEHIFPVRLPVESWDRTLSNAKHHANHNDGGAIICIVFVVAFYVFAVLLLMTSHCRRSRDQHMFDGDGNETVPTLPLLQNQHLNPATSSQTINDQSAIHEQLDTGCSSYQRTNGAAVVSDEKITSASASTIGNKCVALNATQVEDADCPIVTAESSGGSRSGMVFRGEILKKIRRVLRSVTSQPDERRQPEEVDEASQGIFTAGVFQTHVV